MEKKSDIKNRIVLDKLGIELIETIHHDNIFQALGDESAIFSLFSYFSRDMNGKGTWRYAAPIRIIDNHFDKKGNSVIETKLESWVSKEWDKVCKKLRIKKLPNGKGSRISNYDRKKITVLDFMIHLKNNQHTYKA